MLPQPWVHATVPFSTIVPVVIDMNEGITLSVFVSVRVLIVVEAVAGSSASVGDGVVEVVPESETGDVLAEESVGVVTVASWLLLDGAAAMLQSMLTPKGVHAEFPHVQAAVLKSASRGSVIQKVIFILC